MRAGIASSSPRRQRGAALLTAMIIVTLVATLAAAMVWQQWRAVQVEAAERARAQAAWILSGALDFAKLILKNDRKTYTALTEPWATPLAESRLSTFLAIDKSNADDGPEAFLSGNISDAQARYNLNNLLTQDFKPDSEQIAILSHICEAVGIETGIAARIATGLSSANGTNSAGPLKPNSVSQLTWLGLDHASAEALKPYVILLNRGALLNVNTASKEVLAAVTGVDEGTAANLLQVRQRTPFKDLPAFATAAGKSSDSTFMTFLRARATVHSDHFEVRGRLRLVDRVLVERTLLRRSTNNANFEVLERERVASLEQVGG